MSNIKISFCIPTYNRSELLSELIESIVSQCKNRNDIEICISDNASSDNTSEMIAKWKESTDTPIVYKVNKENIGPDRNYLAAVDLASGEYCWLFGSDDRLLSDAIIKMDEHINEGHDIYIVDRIECDFNMKPFSHRTWMSTGSKLYNTSKRTDLIEYFNNSYAVGAVFSYLSSIIVKRSRWNRVKFNPKFIGSCYAHVFYLLDIVNNGAELKYVKSAFVLSRGGNDSFAANGLIKRIEIDFDGYFLLGNEFFSNDFYLNSKFKAILLKEHPVIHTCIKTAMIGEFQDLNKIKRFYIELGIAPYYVSIIYFFKPIYQLANKMKLSFFYKKLRKKITFKKGSFNSID
ncbi:putative glycosyltransferase [Yersinia pseudotuberculosis]|uniref:Putative tyvelose transferase n=1 Tax=Yersinia pseudotuberculosis TaxID=633 RepID=Q8GJ91_YERPU|nr:glycosyltransferase family 2 protein [Yersinia pseudotuberculosis]AAN23055.1 putative tyvelose transferase [Yersinia pseudotuberculosis]BCU91631.1 glycosyl transferase [Yersinia pseudotuberculosis]BET63420.1 glycosyltransferase family 2 protein [Yersinia pseudotuberculosis]CNH71197.1 putative glycosyltransferase [Yersinia pseudotuberculosis]